MKHINTSIKHKRKGTHLPDIREKKRRWRPTPQQKSVKTNDEFDRSRKSRPTDEGDSFNTEGSHRSVQDFPSRYGKCGQGKQKEPHPSDEDSMQVKGSATEDRRIATPERGHQQNRASKGPSRHAQDSARSRQHREAPAALADPLSKRPQKHRQRSSLHIFSGKASQAVTNPTHAKLAARRTAAAAPAPTAAHSHMPTQHDSISHDKEHMVYGEESPLRPAIEQAKLRCESSVALQRPLQAEASVCQGEEPEQQGPSNVPHDQYFKELRSRLRQHFCKVCDLQELGGNLNARIDQVMSRLNDNSRSSLGQACSSPSAQVQPSSCLDDIVEVDDLDLDFLQQCDMAMESGVPLDYNYDGQKDVLSKGGDFVLHLGQSETNSLEHVHVNSSDRLASSTPLGELEMTFGPTAVEDLPWANGDGDTARDALSSPCPSLSLPTSSCALSDALTLSERQSLSGGGPDALDEWDTALQSGMQPANVMWTLEGGDQVEEDKHKNDHVRDFADFCASLRY
ncbi:hypothetical protein COCOBI_04-4930 [Coccomyxa sp. Obi]|nr:hypothetical protein COCOBI_04-4930 [Coccomyxa sp. Obi]